MSFENPKYEKNAIVQLTLDFSLCAIEYTETLEQEKKFVIARQLLKSSTSVGANVREAQNAESKFDFIHKMKVAMKELDETEYWLILCRKAKNYPDPLQLAEKLVPIRKILNKIISSAKIANSPIG